VEALVEAVVAAISVPVIAAGSVDSVERIRALADRGVWAFTIGTAALDGEFVDGAPLQAQLRAVIDSLSGVRS
jgi:phosphoribosylformimino-5-aminoimidazole carboxamide ribonucleotide (ProFAR) isomerase